MEKIQITEEQAREIYKDCILEKGTTTIDCFISGLKQTGYIKQNPVEEAEEMYKTILTGEPIGTSDLKDIIQKQFTAIKYLKSEIERMKEGK